MERAERWQHICAIALPLVALKRMSRKLRAVEESAQDGRCKERGYPVSDKQAIVALATQVGNERASNRPQSRAGEGPASDRTWERGLQGAMPQHAGHNAQPQEYRGILADRDGFAMFAHPAIVCRSKDASYRGECKQPAADGTRRLNAGCLLAYQETCSLSAPVAQDGVGGNPADDASHSGNSESASYRRESWCCAHKAILPFASDRAAEVLQALFDLLAVGLDKLLQFLAHDPARRRVLHAELHLGAVVGQRLKADGPNVRGAAQITPGDALILLLVCYLRVPLLLCAQDTGDPVIPSAAQWAHFLYVGHELWVARKVGQPAVDLRDGRGDFCPLLKGEYARGGSTLHHALHAFPPVLVR